MNPSITIVKKKYNYKSKSYLCPKCQQPVRVETDMDKEIKEILCSVCLGMKHGGGIANATA